MDFNKILSGAKTTIEFGKKHYDKIPNKYKDFIEEESYNLEDKLLSKGNELIKSTNKTEEFRAWLNTPLKWSERDKELLEKSKLILDIIAPAVGSYAGAQLGFAVGSMLAPVTGGISLVIGPILGGIAGFIFGRKFVRSQREGKIIKAYNVFQHSLVELSNRTLIHKKRIRDYLAETTRNQRMAFRKIMVDAISNDGIRLCTKEPSYNFIVLNEIANRYKEDSQIIWNTRKKLTEKVLNQDNIQLGDQVQEVVPYIFENRGIIELSEPSIKPYFEESIDKWKEFNRIKEAYS